MRAALRAALEARADAGKAAGMRAYMKSEMPFLGVQKPDRTAIAREVFPAHPLPDAAAWRAEVLALWHGAEYREERYLALALAGYRAYRPFRTLDALPLYEELIVTGAWWDFVDEVAVRLVGELLPGAAPVLREWSVRDDLWLRRAAIIAQVQRKRHTDLALLYDCIEPNRQDREFFIRKGIGWALRAYAWIDFAEIERYCATQELSPLSRREALRNRDRSSPS